MSFGKKDNKKKKVKKVRQRETLGDDEIRDDLIVRRIVGILENTCAGCCNIEYIKKKISGVNELELYIKKCSKENGYLFHRGWLYNKLWTIDDLNEISNDKIIIDDFDDNHIKIDKDLLIKLTALYEKENEAIKVTWFEGLIKHGMLYITEEQLWQSLERLMRAGKIYEPHIGEFAPTYNDINRLDDK